MSKLQQLVRALIAVLLALPTIMHAQIVNPGLESWTSGEPAGWKTNNANPLTFVTQSADAHGGSSAAQGVVVDFGGGFTFGAIIKTGNTSSDGFPVNQRYAAVHFFYKYTGAGGDQISASAGFSKQGTGIAAGSFGDTASTSAYKEAVIPVTYSDGSAVPDTGVVVVSISPLTGCHAGSTFIVDDFGLDLTTDVTERAPGIPNEFALRQNFPNPFNPTTHVVYDIPASSHVRLAVYDIIGREVAVLVDAIQSPGRYRSDFDASRLTSGVYFYRIDAAGFTRTMRMMVVR
jgi:hypothetical protein